MSTTRRKTRPYDFISRHHRDPGGDDPVARWLPHPDNARAICAALAANGMPEQDIEDGMQDVFVKALEAFRKGARMPADLREMKAFCAAIAKRHAVAATRKAARRARLGDAGPCDADELAPLEHGAPERRDPVDAGRQLEVLAQLFREGCMPEHGVDILEGVACGCSYEQIGAALGITDRAVEGRMGTMLAAFRKRLAQRGLLPGMRDLRLVVSRPAAIETLRRAA
jgi:DNA-directed RNA polymerase specialized sigma24 family protein